MLSEGPLHPVVSGSLYVLDFIFFGRLILR